MRNSGETPRKLDLIPKFLGEPHELIKSGENGIVVPRNSSELIAESAIELLSNPEKADKIGLEAMRLRDRLSPEKIYKQWVEYIEDILNNYHIVKER